MADERIASQLVLNEKQGEIHEHKEAHNKLQEEMEEIEAELNEKIKTELAEKATMALGLKKLESRNEELHEDISALNQEKEFV